MVAPKSIFLPRLLRLCALIIFFASAILALAGISFIASVIGMLTMGVILAHVTQTINRHRVDQMYALLARIGDGELGATLEDSDDELVLRMQRGIARAQRGYAEALARAEIERDELQTLLGAIQTGLISLDAQMRFRSANEVAEKMLGLDSREYRG